MRNVSRFVLFLLAVTCSVANAADWVTYKTQGASHYRDGAIQISHWADSLVMKSTLVDRGREFEVEATLNPQGHDSYRGSGRIIVRYGNNRGCIHRFGAEIHLVNNEIFLRENTPATIPFNPNGPCEAAGPYEWYNHPEPYIAE